jgi:hypothetical protein
MPTNKKLFSKFFSLITNDCNKRYIYINIKKKLLRSHNKVEIKAFLNFLFYFVDGRTQIRISGVPKIYASYGSGSVPGTGTLIFSM